MLFSDTEKKAQYYMVSNYRDERLWANRTIKGTSEEKAFAAISESLGLDIHARRPTLAADAEKHLKEVNQVLAQSSFVEIDKEFEKKKQQSSRRHEPKWHSLCGAQSIRQIAITVGRLPEYELFYAKGSQITHSASYKDHLRFAKGKVIFKHVRQLESINELLNFVVTLALMSYRHTLMRYRPGEVQAFSRKYLEDWRSPF
jgi:phage FluMu gp28-like protein